MAGIKISELNKWSISDIEGVDAKNILIPVTINGVTGCLRANTLVNLLKEAGSDVDNRQDEQLNEFNENLVDLNARFEAFKTEINRKYDELYASQVGIDTNQTNQINQNSDDIDNIINVNNEQSVQIADLNEAHQWENWTDNSNEPQNP